VPSGDLESKLSLQHLELLPKLLFKDQDLRFKLQLKQLSEDRE